MSDPEIGGTGFMPGMVTPSDVFGYMLESSTIASNVINECRLIEHYKFNKIYEKRPDKAMYRAFRCLAKATTIKVTEERFITISVEDKNKIKAAEIANKYGEILDKVYSGMNMSQGSKMREFIEGRVVQEQRTLRIIEDSLRRFQEKHKTNSITEEMKAVIEMSAQLEAKIISQKIELDALRAYSEQSNPQIVVLQTQIDKSRNELNNLMDGRSGKTLFVPFSRAPEIGTRLGQLMRDVRIHQEVYALLVQQLEQAKILEAKDTPKIQFLDKAFPPYKKSWPKKSIFIIVGFLLGLICSTSAIYVIELWNVFKFSGNYEKIFSRI
jgi:uncharacterized protein involved in exopolysaccharide biosynthesis